MSFASPPLRIACLSATLAMLAPVAAMADEVPKILLVGVEPTSTAVPALVPKRAAEMIARDLATQPDVELLSIIDDPKDLESSAPAAPAADRIDEAKTALVAARGAVDSKDWKRAVDQARRAAEAYEASAAVLTSVDPLVEAYIVAGVAHANLGKDVDARTAFRQALAFEPLPLPDLSRHGKKVGKQWDTARAEYTKVARAAVEVDVAPSEATAAVYVDGTNYGDGPVNAQELGPGVHLIRVTAEGYRPFGARVLLASGATEKLAVVLEPTVAAAGKPDAVRAALRSELRKRAGTGLLDARAKPLAARLAERVGATHLVVGMIVASGKGYTVRVFVFRAKDSKLVELDSLELDSELLQIEKATLGASRAVLAAIRDFPVDRDISTNIEGSGHKDVDRSKLIGDGKNRQRRDGPVDGGTPPIYRKWWFWTGVSAVVVGAVVTGVLISGGEASGYEGMVVLP